MPPRRTTRPRLHYRIERARLRMLGDGTVIAGIDEAGIGPWAGPVVAAAVCLDPRAVPRGLADSKLLTAEARAELFDIIMERAAVGIGIADVDHIDRANILAASHWAMAEAVGKLPCRPDLALIDGRLTPAVGCPAEALIGGDGKVASIAAASIIAKVTRDRVMVQLALRYPGYGFERHMGYGTAEHRSAIRRLGVSACHRRSFKPVQVAMTADAAYEFEPALTLAAGDCD